MTQTEALEHALNVLKGCLEHPDAQDAIDGIEAALAQTEQEHPKVCCGEYATCTKPCTPRGRWLAQPEQEPVAFCDPTDPRNETAFSWTGTACKKEHTTPLHTSQPQRKPLTINDIKFIATYCEGHVTDEDVIDITRRVEAAHDIKE